LVGCAFAIHIGLVGVLWLLSPQAILDGNQATGGKRNKNYWWSEELRIFRAEVFRKRREVQRAKTRGLQDADQLISEFKRKRSSEIGFLKTQKKDGRSFVLLCIWTLGGCFIGLLCPNRKVSTYGFHVNKVQKIVDEIFQMSPME
jgi:hypothetical protein